MPSAPIAKRVLVVDDHTATRAMLRAVLMAEKGVSFEVVEAATGADALEALEQLGPFDLVLLDVRLPDMDGIETARRLAGVDPRPVVVLVSIDAAPDAEAALASAGAAAYVRKQDLSTRKLHELWASLGRQG